MEVPQTEQENVDYFATKPSVKIETNILNSTKIKLKHVKLEPDLYVPEPNNLVQKCNIKDRAKLIENDDKCNLNCLINKIYKEKGSDIKHEESEATDGYEKIDEVAEVKQEIKNEELIIKDEINIEDQEQRNVSPLVFRQQHHETSAASSSKKSITDTDNLNSNIAKYEWSYKCVQCDYRGRNLTRHVLIHRKPDRVDMYKCDQCNYQTVYKSNLKKHSLLHKKVDKVYMYKCSQCDYQAIRKSCLKEHSIKHKNGSVEIDMFKCDQCDYQTIRKATLKRHSLVHKNSDEVYMFKCDQCNYQTVRKGCLKEHSIKHKKFNEVDVYKCDQCKYQTVFKKYLTKHSLKHKNSDEVIMFKCEQCDYQTIRKNNLKIHSLKHKKLMKS